MPSIVSLAGEEGGHAERQPQEAPLQREGWMTDPSLARKRTAEQEREEQEAAEEEERKRKVRRGCEWVAYPYKPKHI
jgi:hypothetical protein